jgi:toxin-antitoxin system PIN domain toxin
MLLCDVNVLVNAHRESLPDHDRCRRWLEGVAKGNVAFGLSDLVLSGFVRVVTHPRVFRPTTPIDEALRFAQDLREQPHAVMISPGPRHWDLFVELCRRSSARGNLVPDAYLAALAIESGCEWVTLDQGFGRFPELRWRAPE